jgi:hypothetical protein
VADRPAPGVDTLIAQLGLERRARGDAALLRDRPPVAATSPARFVVRLEHPAGDNGEALPPALEALPGPVHVGDARGAPPEWIAAEPMFPDAGPDGALARYWVVVAPIARGECRSQGHDLAYALHDLPGADAAFYEDVYDGFTALAMDAGAPLADDYDPKATTPRWANRLWARRSVRADAKNLPGHGGKGVVIAHVDTGWHEHVELDVEALDLERSRNVLHAEAQAGAVDPLTNVPGFQPGHGTGTASVLVSSHKRGGNVFGVAPAARLIPIRCADSVIVVSGLNVARAFHYAAAQGAHVITMSMGGFPSKPLEDALKSCVWNHDMIVCTAAGNAVERTVFPASYPECVSVAGCTSSDHPWSYSSHGKTVDITAPASRVWAAHFDKPKHDRPVVIAGGGTSYATPLVAGAAALWLAHHGRARLRKRYAGQAALQEVFRHLLRRTARDADLSLQPETGKRDDDQSRPVTAWDQTNWGPGILDVAALLDAPLPSVDEVEPVLPEDRFKPMPLRDVLDVVFPRRSGAEVEQELADRIEAAGHDADRALSRFGPELARLAMTLDPDRAETTHAADALAGSASLALKRLLEG